MRKDTGAALNPVKCEAKKAEAIGQCSELSRCEARSMLDSL